MTKFLIQRWVLVTQDVTGFKSVYRLIYRAVANLAVKVISRLPAVRQLKLIRGEHDTAFSFGLSDLDFVAVLDTEKKADYLRTVRSLGRLNSYLPRSIPIFQFCFSIDEGDLAVPALSQWIGIHQPRTLSSLGHDVKSEFEGARRVVALRSAYRWFFEYYYPNATSTPRFAATIRNEKRRYFRILRDLYFGIGRCDEDVFTDENRFSAVQEIWSSQLALEPSLPGPTSKLQRAYLKADYFRALWNEFQDVSCRLVRGRSSALFTANSPSFPALSPEMRTVFGSLFPQGTLGERHMLSVFDSSITKWINTFECLQAARDFRESLVDSKEKLLEVVYHRVPRTLDWVRNGVFSCPDAKIPDSAFSLSKWRIYRAYYDKVANSHRELLDYIQRNRAAWCNLPCVDPKGPLRALAVLLFFAATQGQAADGSALPDLAAEVSLPSSVGWQKPPEWLSFIEQIADDTQRERVRYGKELFLRTAFYLGPKGKVAQHTNRMNCQNCHLDAGLKKYGNDLLHAASRYPMYRAREGRILSLKARINNCVERPLNGKPLATEGREMEGLHAYISWLNTLPLARQHVSGENLMRLTYPNRAADPKRGAKLFTEHCARCHGADGSGILHADEIAFAYPPLWGPESFSAGSSMTRVTKLAAFIRANMPYGVTWDRPLLSNDEALDVAAYITKPSHSRPMKFDPSKDFPILEEKPIDLVSGPYADPFSAEQHWLGPFQPIADYHLSRKAEAAKWTSFQSEGPR